MPWLRSVTPGFKGFWSRFDSKTDRFRNETQPMVLTSSLQHMLLTLAQAKSRRRFLRFPGNCEIFERVTLTDGVSLWQAHMVHQYRLAQVRTMLDAWSASLACNHQPIQPINGACLRRPMRLAAVALSYLPPTSQTLYQDSGNGS